MICSHERMIFFLPLCERESWKFELGTRGRCEVLIRRVLAGAVDEESFGFVEWTSHRGRLWKRERERKKEREIYPQARQQRVLEAFRRRSSQPASPLSRPRSSAWNTTSRLERRKKIRRRRQQSPDEVQRRELPEAQQKSPQRKDGSLCVRDYPGVRRREGRKSGGAILEGIEYDESKNVGERARRMFLATQPCRCDSSPNAAWRRTKETWWTAGGGRSAGRCSIDLGSGSRKRGRVLDLLESTSMIRLTGVGKDEL